MKPPTQQVKRSVRLMSMRDLLSHELVTIDDLASRYGVSRRTVYNDLQDLQLAPISFQLTCQQLWGSYEVFARLCKDSAH